MESECVNLKERFGDQHRVVYEDSREAEYGLGARTEDPWLMILLCQYGHICPWGGNNLAACTARPGRIAGNLKRLPFTEVVQDGDDGANVVFAVEHFDEVAEIMKPRKRRRVSETLRQHLAEIGQQTRFLHGAEGHERAGTRDPTDEAA